MDRQNSDDIMRFLDGMASSDDVLFGFLDEGNQSPEDFSDSVNLNAGGDDGDEDDNNNNSEENKAFWQEQEQLLQGTLYRTSSIETKIRQATKEALKQVKSKGLNCVCRRPVDGGCRSCLRGEISRHLRDVAGYDSVISKSKWRSCQDIPAGEHEFIEIVDRSGSKKGEMRVVIELSFRAEFEIAKGSEEYKRLVSRLPEVYVGKTERLRSLIKILCIAGKKCLRDKKMHMAPWRKHKYMQAKWLGTCDRSSSLEAAVSEAMEPENWVPVAKPRVSMLNYDGLLGSFSAGPATVTVV
ncbi:PDDEXK-like [Arabidopsis thaliana x Arabidopsis arenosa]|uniref:PDDEXK-like n=1 Tax=Arabidopsis thaliana x Arabidopsis arenosa TaxID=1240361 RepID=A0A8T2B2E8_9BRAS|nr:PDDEXK-like [Arabidopsis thaliana x Arabidopsis arenosa]